MEGEVSRHRTSFLDLPDDVLGIIFSHALYSSTSSLAYPYIRSPESYALPRICRRLYEPVMSVLYRHVYLDSYESLRRHAQSLHFSSETPRPLGHKVETYTFCLRDGDDDSPSISMSVPPISIYYIFDLFHRCPRLTAIEFEFVDLDLMSNLPSDILEWGLQGLRDLAKVVIQRTVVLESVALYKAFAAIAQSAPQLVSLRLFQLSIVPVDGLPPEKFPPLSHTNPLLLDLELREFSAPLPFVNHWIANHPRLHSLTLRSVSPSCVDTFIRAAGPTLGEIEIDVFHDPEESSDPDWVNGACISACRVLKKFTINDIRHYPSSVFLQSLPPSITHLSLSFTDWRAAIPAREILAVLLSEAFLPSLSSLMLHISVKERPSVNPEVLDSIRNACKARNISIPSSLHVI